MRRIWYLSIIRLRRRKLEVTAAFLSGNGSFVDVRYRLTRPDKAEGRSHIFLIDEASGEVLPLMVLPKQGAVRTKHKNDQRTGVLLFRNQKHFIKSGSKVTLVFGQFVVKNIEIK
ncbi:hypothetical protein [Bacillus sp. REN10]|uniref:hypothetical protein n=1 Tax=Bacillus sp. REN10 TaxID=2782541 RepID=UPI00193B5303|nr:hypothetical protein [Bacillus sp. REN10]